MANEMRMTFFFKSTDSVRAVGWTEVFWHKTADVDYTDALKDADSLAIARSRLLGTGYELSYFRASREGVFRDSELSDLGPYTGQMSGSKLVASPGDFAYSALLVRMESGPKNRRFMYLSGAPDNLQVINSLPTDIAFRGVFGAWARLLQNNWAYFGLVKGADNKAPKKVLNPNPPPKYNPRAMVLYPFTFVKLMTYAEHRRGRPFDLLRGRRKKIS